MKFLNILFLFLILHLRKQNTELKINEIESTVSKGEKQIKQSNEFQSGFEKNSNNSVKPKERKLYQTWNVPNYQPQYQPQIAALPPTIQNYSPPLPQYQQQPLYQSTNGYVNQQQVQQPIYNQQPIQLTQVAQPEIQQDQGNTQIVEESNLKDERKLQKQTSALHPEFQDIKESLLNFVGQKKHYFFMERSLSNHFCSYQYCKVGEDVYEKNNVEKPQKMSHDVMSLRKACMNKCSRVSNDEARYQKINVLEMNNSASKRRILKIFHISFNTPHFCLLLQYDKVKYSNEICSQINVLDQDCHEHYLTIEKACQAKRKLFDYSAAYIKNKNKKLKKKERMLYNVNQKSYFANLETSCSNCSHQINFYNNFYCNERKLIDQCQFYQGLKKNTCVQERRNMLIDCKANSRTSCYQFCRKEGDINIPKEFPGLTQSYQCKEFCVKNLVDNRICSNQDANCKNNFKTQCHSECERQLSNQKSLRKGRVLHMTSQLQYQLQKFNKDQQIKASYDVENIRKTLTIVDYENRAEIFDVILQTEENLYKNQKRTIYEENNKSIKFEENLQTDINKFYQDEENLIKNPDSPLNIFDLQLQQFNLNLLINERNLKHIYIQREIRLLIEISFQYQMEQIRKIKVSKIQQILYKIRRIHFQKQFIVKQVRLSTMDSIPPFLIINFQSISSFLKQSHYIFLIKQ